MENINLATPSQDIRYTLMPLWFDQYWNFPRHKPLVRLERMAVANRLPQFLIFAGPPGAGKNAAAYILGMMASCERWHPDSHAPCGVCQDCEFVRLGRDHWHRRGMIEIEGGGVRESDAASKDILEAFETTMRSGSRLCGDPNRKPIVFIDEMHRLPLATKAAMLTLLQRWPMAHVVGATTDIRRLQCEPDRPPKEDPLISRGDVIMFDLPTIEEASLGLVHAAGKVGLSVTPDAAHAIAARNHCSFAADRAMPRDCIGDLYKLSAYASEIGLDHVRELYEDISMNGISVQAQKPANNAESELY